ncbi:EAL domain-containing protein [Sulfurovum lithotrophicum]|uniref:EAL domain-containing protein n=1 Tax=Sulfurovum lithotrophicum TaxID=206403 RepID=UPI0006973E54|nr:EAL domain-containing protein [Sulfurovum lithotrophicum]
MKRLKFFILFAVLLFVVLFYRTYEQYQEISKVQKLIVLHESKSLAEFISSFRQTYQDVFLREHIKITDSTLNLLPVKTITEISEHFSSKINGEIVVRTVSDRPRNPLNKVDRFEAQMINYFKSHPKEKYKFVENEETYSYIKPLYIEKSCLRCHGKREEAVPSIRKRYDKAYDYKLGEIRGVMHIKIKERDLFTGLYGNFLSSLLAAILIYVLLLVVIYLLIKRIHRKEEEYLARLEEDIAKKTREISRQKETFETLFEKSSDGILIVDGPTFIECNEKMVEILKYGSKKELLNMHYSDMVPKFQPDGRNSYEKSKEMVDLARRYKGYQFECVYLRANGEKFLAEVTLTPILLEEKHVIYTVVRDISEKKKAQMELLRQKDILHHQAHHDALTGLPNRILFSDRLEHGLKLAERQLSKVALFFIDLDNFKQINDSLGHHIGDKVLKVVSERLKAKIRKEDTLARLGGDEFTIIMENFNEIQEVSGLAQKIQTVLTQPMHIEGHTLYISCSIGISFYPQDAQDANDLLKYADAAMYKAKEEGRNNFQFYSSEMTTLAYERVVMEASLRQAIKNEEFLLYYQPQVNAQTSRMIGMEALIRWKHPHLGMILPDKFIPLAEETGLILEIDRWVMRTAMRQVRQWYARGLDPGVLSLNLSMRQLKDGRFIDVLKECLDTMSFKSVWLELEVTEGQMMKNPDEAVAILDEIKAMGISVAIDDFGTGYSSLSYLKRLPVSRLKIDQSFIHGIPEDRENAAIVKATIALAKSLNLQIIAEGVENEAQKAFLVYNGCIFMQGYYYGRPMTAKQIEIKCFDIC